MLNFHDPDKHTPKPVMRKERDRENVEPPEVTAFKALLRRGRTERFTAEIEVTPALAAFILEINFLNRVLNKEHANKWARAMARGEWHINSTLIGVSKEGVLSNGQHRLNGVLISGLTVLLAFYFGLEPASRATEDKGRRRTTGDELTMEGFANGNSLAVAATFGHHYGNERTALSGELSFAQVKSWIDANPDISEYLKVTNGITRQFKVSHGAVAFAAYECHRFNPKKAADFLAQVKSGVNIPSTQAPANKLRQRFIQNASKKRLMNRYEVAATYILGFNAFLRGRSGGALEFVAFGPKADVFPRVGSGQ